MVLRMVFNPGNENICSELPRQTCSLLSWFDGPFNFSRPFIDFVELQSYVDVHDIQVRIILNVRWESPLGSRGTWRKWTETALDNRWLRSKDSAGYLN